MTLDIYLGDRLVEVVEWTSSQRLPAVGERIVIGADTDPATYRITGVIWRLNPEHRQGHDPADGAVLDVVEWTEDTGDGDRD